MACSGAGLYSLGYLAEKPDRPRFFAELGLFIGAMLAWCWRARLSFCLRPGSWSGSRLTFSSVSIMTWPERPKPPQRPF